MSIRVFVPGQPAPQGSKRHVGHGIMVESCKQVKPWRSDIRSHLLDAAGQPLHVFGDAPVHVSLEFIMRRPKSAPKRTTPPAVKKPDLDKLARAVLDAISSAGVWGDDSQVVSARLKKRIALVGEQSGCWIDIHAAVMD